MGKPSIPKGTRDFLPEQMAGRNYIFDTAKSVFKKFGFLQIETPAIENLSTLTGKYGEEGDQLMFKILNRGDKFKKAVDNILKFVREDFEIDGVLYPGKKNFSEKDINPSVLKLLRREADFAELALKYDQTVPFARFVVQNQNELAFPFKRYQIQPVWRADRPGKGRYREFYQCDVDVVGTDSLLCEVEFIQIYNEVLSKLKIPNFTIKMNNRKVLAGIAEVTGEKDKMVDITVSIDKLDKIGIDKVKEEMLSKGVSQSAIDKIQPFLELSGTFEEKTTALKEILSDSETGLKGVKELEFIYNYCEDLDCADTIELDVTLARGLNYYTGAIFEVVSEGFKGSICGGGRYDGLTDQFGLKGMGCVGISFGADRIYDVMLENDLFPKEKLDSLDVLFVNFGDAEQKYIMPLAGKLREVGVSVEVYPTSAKMKKQMSYADAKGAKFVVMIGENEMSAGKVRVKNMISGAQEDITFSEFLEKL